MATPTVTPAGQEAVNAYISMTNVVNRWALDPSVSLAAQLRPFVSSTVLKEIASEYQLLASKHRAYRGSPDTPHLNVISAASSATVLSDCSVAAPTDPFVQYDVNTGKVIEAPAGGPYLKAVTVLRSDGEWRVNSIVPDTAKVCHA